MADWSAKMERDAVVKRLRSEAGDAKRLQDAADGVSNTRYRMGQKDAFLIAVEAIERGHHAPRGCRALRQSQGGDHG